MISGHLSLYVCRYILAKTRTEGTQWSKGYIALTLKNVICTELKHENWCLKKINVERNKHSNA